MGLSRPEGVGGGGWEAKGRPNQQFELKQQYCAFSMGPEWVQSTGSAKTAIRSSLVPHAVLLMLLRAEKWINRIGKKLSAKANLAIYMIKYWVFLGSV